ncbi:MAG: type I-E CRISPR-associated endoribonuclease Cas2e [Syntrophomonadaceae bacterium]|jgi:CRISPR-associated protein Cas2|nr:type I-E CRISPR-associated endoribonuclease Cas2e [Syntrophomonadaceae bacterium]
MVVISLTNCQISLRGDLKKWLLEIDTGVFVGQVSARVREQLWKRIQKSTKEGRAIMVFNTNNEQGLDFKVHNSNWIPIDFDGLKLILRPSSPVNTQNPKLGYSKASKFHMARQASKRRVSKTAKSAYVVVDVETTGLNPEKDAIIMLSALKVTPKQQDVLFDSFIRTNVPISAQITKLTGISAEMLALKGRDSEEVMREFSEFVGDFQLVAHNVKFDIAFLNAARKNLLMEPLTNEMVDTLALAKKKLCNLKNYKMATIANHYGIDSTGAHNASSDCLITKEIYECLIKESE